MPPWWGFSSFSQAGGWGLWIIFCPRGGQFAHQKNCPGGDGQAWSWLIHNTSILLRETFFERVCVCGGGGEGVVIQESNYQFFKWKHYQRTLLAWKDFIININLGQTNSLNFNKFSIGNNVPDCLSAPFTYGLLVLAKARFLCIIYNNITASNDQ